MGIRRWERMKISTTLIRRQQTTAEWQWHRLWAHRVAPIQKGTNQSREGTRSRCCHRNRRWSLWPRCPPLDPLMIMHRMKGRLCSEVEADSNQIAATFRLLSPSKITIFSRGFLYSQILCVFCFFCYNLLFGEYFYLNFLYFFPILNSNLGCFFRVNFFR